MFLYTIGSSSSSVEAFSGSVPAGVVSANTVGVVFNFTSTSVAASSVMVSQRSLYWHHLSVGVPAGNATHCQMNGFDYPANVIATSSDQLPDDTPTSDTMQWMSPYTPVSLTNGEAVFSSATNPETAWLGVRLDTLFSPLVAFFVQSTFTNVNVPGFGPIPYGQVFVNEGSAWDAVANQFTAPHTGAYFFAYSSAVPPSANTIGVTISLNGNSDWRHTAMFFTSNLDGYQLNRAAMMLSLNAGDYLQFYSQSWSPPLNNVTMYVSGFLYSPIVNTTISPAVAWSVTYTGIYGVGSGHVTGPVSVMLYDTIEVNMGNGWQVSSNTIIVPADGLYIVDVTTYMCNASVGGAGDCLMQVMLNSITPILVIRQSPLVHISDCMTRGRSVLVSLQAGDTLYVTLPTNCTFYRGYQRVTSFVGFRLG